MSNIIQRCFYPLEKKVRSEMRKRLTVDLLHLVKKVTEEGPLVSVIVFVHAGLVGAVIECKLGTFNQS